MNHLGKRRNPFKSLLLWLFLKLEPYQWEFADWCSVTWYGQIIYYSRLCNKLSDFIWSRLEPCGFKDPGDIRRWLSSERVKSINRDSIPKETV